MKIALIVGCLTILVWLGVTNSPPNIELPNDVQIRTLQPGELRVSGMTPVISDYGDWYDGCNYTASPQWNAEHNNGNMWTSTCMGCSDLVAAVSYTGGYAKGHDEIEKANSP